MPKQSCKKRKSKQKGKKHNFNTRKSKQPGKNCKSIQQKYNPSILDAALKAVTDGGISFRKASTTFGVPTTTLFRHHTDPEKVTWKKGPPTVFTKAEEEDIVQWIQYRAERGFPVDKTELLDCLQTFIRQLKRKTPFNEDRPGRHWYESFFRRHPILSERIPQHLTRVRAEVTQEDLKEWFAEIGQYLERKNLLNISAERVFNCDETNIMLCPKSGKVLTMRGARNVYKIVDAGEKESVTTLFTYSAQGIRAPPMVLYKYIEGIPKKVLENIPSGWGVGISESGWMTIETFYEYITNIFYPWLIQEKVEFPVVLYLDGHSSHVTVPLVSFCREKGIELISFYPNATHILQPLDVAFFHPFKEQWMKTVPKWKNEFNMTRLHKHQFPAVLEMALAAIEKESEIIQSGFRSCGLMPFNSSEVEFNVLKKKKKVKQRSADLSENKQLENPVSHDDQFVSTFEKSLPSDILKMFTEAQPNEIWAGDVKYTALFNYWLQLKKPDDNGRKKCSVKNLEILKNHTVRLLPEFEHKNNDTNQTLDSIRKPSEEFGSQIITEEIIDSSFENYSIDQEIVLIPEVIVEKNLNHDILKQLAEQDIENNAKTYLITDDGSVIYREATNLCIDLVSESRNTSKGIVLEKSQSEVSADSGFSDKCQQEVATVESLDHPPDANKENVLSTAESVTFKEIFIDHVSGSRNTSNVIERSQSEVSADSSFSDKCQQEVNTVESLNHLSDANKENVVSTAESVTFKEIFTLPEKYLPKKRRDKLKGKKKLPSAGTSDEWFAIHAEKEKVKIIKQEKQAEKKKLQQEKQAEKKKLQEEKKLLAEKKKQLTLEMKQLTKRMKQEKV